MNLKASLLLNADRGNTAAARSRPPSSTGVSKRVVAATVAGNALEFYDFVT